MMAAVRISWFRSSPSAQHDDDVSKRGVSYEDARRRDNSRIEFPKQEFHDHVALLESIKACVLHNDLHAGCCIHSNVRHLGLLQRNVYLGTALITMYAKFGEIRKAREVFDELSVRNVVSWNALITGYVQCGLLDYALECFRQMEKDGFCPNDVTFACVLKACGSLCWIETGKHIHDLIQKEGSIENNTMLSTALVDMYAKCGAIGESQMVFDGLRNRDVISWTALISAYANQGLGSEALNCFLRMQEEGLSPNAVTFACILKACSSIGSISKGEEIHVRVNMKGLLGNSIVLGNALVDLYAKCNMLARAMEVFNGLQLRDIVTWNVLVSGYTQHGYSEEALKCFEQMQSEGFHPDAVTFSSILKACGDLGSLEMGKDIHGKINNQCLWKNNTVIGNALVDMYFNCGMWRKAQEVFDGLPVQDTVSWTALITGYAQLGYIRDVLTSFRKMTVQCIMPDSITFLVLLTACSHAGLIEEGRKCLDLMNVYSLIPDVEHYTRMVDLFTRAGHFDNAAMVIEKVPPADCAEPWAVLLGACRKWVNVELGKWAFESSVKLDEYNGSLYVCMSDIYVAAGMREEAAKVEVLRIKNGAWSMGRSGNMDLGG